MLFVETVAVLFVVTVAVANHQILVPLSKSREIIVILGNSQNNVPLHCTQTLP